MPSFRSRIRLSALFLIGALLVIFSLLLYSGLSVILHRYLDARLLVFGENWADFIEETNEALPDSTHQPAFSMQHETDSEENRELREVAHSLLILSPDGAIVWKGASAQTRPSLPEPLRAKVLRGETVYDTIAINNAPPVRRISVPVMRNGAVRYILQAETSMRFVQHTLEQLLALLAVIAVLMLGLAWVVSRWLADEALTPVETLSATAEQISGSSLKTRVSLNAPYAEFQRLAHAFNAMLERLQRVFEAQRRFIADAAHELKTPLTVIMGSLEVTLKKARSAEEYREVLIGNLGQVERLIALTRSLLTMARFTSERPPLHVASPVAIEPLVKNLIAELAVLAENRHITLAVDAHPVPTVRGDEGWLRHMLINLLDNALRYTPSGGTVTVCVEEVGNEVMIAVKDTGPGVAP
ncbi:MAG TPA: histidine kinase dimerization/phospho-acceptor domain-containing protein, partial [Nitrospiraceae bacterium]|nr:histidine kinase dimerization/phospho-acceptor domain-containing protein [Nitrospiraceae bacterium]